MRTRFILIFVFALIAIAATVLTRAMFSIPSQDELKKLLSSSWYATTRDQLSFDGQPEFSIFPRPEISLQSPKIRAGNGLNIQANRITFSVNPLSLFTGHYKIETMTVEDGEAEIPDPFNPRGRQDTERLVKTLVGYFDDMTKSSEASGLSSIHLHNVKLGFATPHPLTPLVVDDAFINLGSGGALSLVANAKSHDVSFDVQFTLAASTSQSDHERSADFTYHDRDLKISGKGIIATSPDVQFIGPISFKTENLSHALSRLADLNNPAFAKAANMKADARMSFSALTLSQMQWSISKAKLDGNMLLDFNRPLPQITGTFAANEMDLTEFISHIGVKRDALGNWSDEKFKTGFVPDLDLDLRLSSDLVMVHDLTMKSVAVSVISQDRKLEISLVTADLFDGSIAGKVNVTPQSDDGRQNVKIQVEINQIDLDRSLLALIDSKRVSGLASGQISLQADGRSTSELVSSLSGLVELEASRISFSGLNLLNFLHRVEQRPLGAGIALKSGTTEFDTMQTTLSLQNGLGTFKTANFTRLPDLQIKLSGQIDLVGQSFALSGHALGASANDINQSINLPFVLRGPFDNPAFLPDFVNVSKQTGSIAP